MSVALKGLGLAAGAGLLATGTYFMVSGSRYMPEYTTIESDSAYTAANALAKGYKHILVDTSSPNNKGWWQWSFDRLPPGRHGKSDLFATGKITSAFSSSDSKALNKVCEEAYKKAETEIAFDKGSDQKNKLGEDVLRYCSPLGQKPTTIDDYSKKKKTTAQGRNSGSIGSGTDKSTLISAEAPENSGFWEVQHRHLMKHKPTDAFFGRIDDANRILSLCKAAYGSTSATEASLTQPKLEDAKKHCSFGKLTS